MEEWVTILINLKRFIEQPKLLWEKPSQKFSTSLCQVFASYTKSIIKASLLIYMHVLATSNAGLVLEEEVNSKVGIFNLKENPLLLVVQ